MKIEPTALPGVLLITPHRHGDHRGFFAESYNRLRMAEAGIGIEFVQDNHSLSEAVGTIRGLHFQAPPHAQDKLIRCGHGAFLDVAVDIRRGSPGYGRWVAVELSCENARQMLIPVGFAHGFITLTPQAEIVYKCSDYYAPETEGAIRWNDPGIGIDWGLPEGTRPVVSDRDAGAPWLSEIDSPFTYEGPLPWEAAR
ncbi:MAG: dTDP-4-dehydrorhamnose 3,5-epimerase [Limimaricola soesokkakensis]|uniref:dTDP-4-dehydrorhamnose 3,5-epimerase n=1 Tax=Limimaricola soesokkakensis TaxID=1343159 RepID=UPI004058796E